MSELRVLPGGPGGAEPEPQPGMVPVGQRIPVVVHRMDGGLENGESEARALSAAGFPIFTRADPDRPRLIPITDIKYVVLGSVEDPNLEADPGEKAAARKALVDEQTELHRKKRSLQRRRRRPGLLLLGSYLMRYPEGTQEPRACTGKHWTTKRDKEDNECQP